MKKFCIIRDALFNVLEDEYDLYTGSVLSVNVTLVLARPPYKARSARVPSSSRQHVLSKRSMKDAERVACSFTASVAQAHTFCLHFMTHHWNTGLCAAKQKIEDVGRDLKGDKEKFLEICEVQDQALLYIKSCRVYNRNLRRKSFFHTSVSETRTLL